MKKTYKGEKIEKNETEMFEALENIQNEWVEGLKKKASNAMDCELVGTQIANLADDGLFTEAMINKYYLMLKSVEVLNFRHSIVVPYIIGYSDNVRIQEYNVALLNKCGIKARNS